MVAQGVAERWARAPGSGISARKPPDQGAAQNPASQRCPSGHAGPSPHPQPPSQHRLATSGVHRAQAPPAAPQRGKPIGAHTVPSQQPSGQVAGPHSPATQVWLPGSHVAPPVQSAPDRHTTHRFVVRSHLGVLPEQSKSPEHGGTAVRHVCVARSHVPPPQSAPDRHTTHWFVVRSHRGVVPEQSKSPAHAGADVRHVRVAGSHVMPEPQSLPDRHCTQRCNSGSHRPGVHWPSEVHPTDVRHWCVAGSHTAGAAQGAQVTKWPHPSSPEPHVQPNSGHVLGTHSEAMQIPSGGPGEIALHA